MQMINIYLLALLLPFALIGGEKTLENKAHGYQITLPADWEVKENVMGSDFIALHPDKDDYQENVNVMVEPMHTKVDPDAYFDFGIKSLKRTLNNFKLIDAKKLSLDGVPAIRLFYTFQVDDLTSQILQYIVIDNSRKLTYILTLSAHPSTFQKHRETFNKIAKSFHIR